MLEALLMLMILALTPAFVIFVCRIVEKLFKWKGE